MRGARVLLVVAWAGCAPSEVDVYLALPPAPDARRLVFDVPGTATPVVVDPAAPGDFVVRLDASESTPPVEVLAYDDDALPVGPLEAARVDEIALSLPKPDDVFQLAVDDATASWVPQTTSALASSFRRRLCEPINAVTDSWDVPGFAHWALTVGDEVVFAVAMSSTIEMYRTDGGPPVKLANPFGPREAPWSVWRAANDVVWFGATNGRLYRGRITRDGIVDVSEQFSFGRTFGYVSGLDGHLDASGNLELFATTDYGDVVHFDGRAFTMVDGAFEFAELRVAWHGPGEAIVIEHDTTNVARVVNGRLRRFAGPEEVILAIASTPTFGAVVGLANGVYARLDGDVWTPLGGSFSTHVLAILPTEDGFYHMLATGRVGRYYAQYGFCDEQGVLPVLGFRGVLARLGDDLFAVGELNSSQAVTQGARVVVGDP